jgi:hypothetical protein
MLILSTMGECESERVCECKCCVCERGTNPSTMRVCVCVCEGELILSTIQECVSVVCEGERVKGESISSTIREHKCDCECVNVRGS